MIQAVSVLNTINSSNKMLIVQLMTAVLIDSVNYCVAAEGEGHYSHDCAASQVVPARVAHALSVPAQACSEFETPTDSFSQAFLSVHAAPAPPVQWIHSTLNT
jgi:hypothetical protein